MPNAALADPLADFFAHCPALLFVADTAGTLTRQSAPLERLLGRLGTAGKRLAELVHPADLGTFEAEWSKLLESEYPVEMNLRLRAGDGAYHALSCSARRSPARGEIHGQLRESVAARDPGLERLAEDARLLRILLDNLSITLWVIDPQGVMISNDGKGLTLLGYGPGHSVGRSLFDFIAGDPAEPTVRRALAGEPGYAIREYRKVPWENWYIPVKDERGEVEAVVGIALDMTQARRAEEELRERIALIERQQQVIRALGTPIIEVWDKVLTLPMLGAIDGARAAEVMEDLLTHVSQKGSRFAILDLTGVDAMDTDTAFHLLELVQALRLLGAEGVITGIQPDVAETMVTLGVPMENVVTMAKLRDGLKLCIGRLREDRG